MLGSARPTITLLDTRYQEREWLTLERTDAYECPRIRSALEASVLVLNKMFMAVHVISVRRAFCLLIKDLAEVVTLDDGQYTTYDFSTWCEVSEYRLKNFHRNEDDDWVRTSTTEIQAPRVIRLLSYDRVPSNGQVQPKKHLRSRR